MKLLVESADIGLHEIFSRKYWHGSTWNSYKIHRKTPLERIRQMKILCPYKNRNWGAKSLSYIWCISGICVGGDEPCTGKSVITMSVPR